MSDVAQGVGPQYDSTQDTTQHIAQVRANMLEIEINLSRRAFRHDDSKLREPEKSAFDKATPALQMAEYPSPEYDAAKAQLGDALTHHYLENDHHPEHWPFPGTALGGIRIMSLTAQLEMLADWKAAAERQGKTLRDSLETNFKRFGTSPEQEAMLLNTCIELGWVES